eukprot:IDg20123t1
MMKGRGGGVPRAGYAFGRDPDAHAGADGIAKVVGVLYSVLQHCAGFVYGGVGFGWVSGKRST